LKESNEAELENFVSQKESLAATKEQLEKL